MMAEPARDQDLCTYEHPGDEMFLRLEARLRCSVGIALAHLIVGLSCFGQTRALTANDYARAEKFMGYNTNPLVLGAGIRPRWLADDRFWYRVTTPAGS